MISCSALNILLLSLSYIRMTYGNSTISTSELTMFSATCPWISSTSPSWMEISSSETCGNERSSGDMPWSSNLSMALGLNSRVSTNRENSGNFFSLWKSGKTRGIFSTWTLSEKWKINILILFHCIRSDEKFAEFSKFILFLQGHKGWNLQTSRWLLQLSKHVLV